MQDINRHPLLSIPSSSIIVNTIVIHYFQYYLHLLLSIPSSSIIVNTIVIHYCQYYRNSLLSILSSFIIVNTIVIHCQYYRHPLLSILSPFIIVNTIVIHYCQYYHSSKIHQTNKQRPFYPSAVKQPLKSGHGQMLENGFSSNLTALLLLQGYWVDF